jgi:transposase
MTGLVDLRRSRLLDVVDGRAGSAVSGWLAEREPGWLAAVERVALDPYRGYYNALVGGLDAPEVVVDAFHIVRLGNVMVDEVRRRVQQDTLGHRGHKHDPLYGIRRLLLTGEERLSGHGRQRIAAGLAADEAAAREALADFYDVAAAADIPECDRLARTIRRWEHAVLAYYHSDGLRNARTEAINGLMKKVKRVGHGFRNLRNYRLRPTRPSASPRPWVSPRPNCSHPPPARRGHPRRDGRGHPRRHGRPRRPRRPRCSPDGWAR